MKQILKKIFFIATVVLMIFAVVASDEIIRHQLGRTAQPLSLCLITNSLPCTDVSQGSKSLPFIPDPQLDYQERFLSTVTNKLKIIPRPDTFEYTLLKAYGAVFVNQNPEIQLPQKVLLVNEQETTDFQATLIMGKVANTNDCYLQNFAALALNKAQTLQNIPLKSGYGTGDCTRSFATNLRFWNKYANNQTLTKVQQGKETKILGKVAPPGASQHLWGLAIDLRVSSQKQRQSLNQNGWFQTVENDVPHWTYVGLPEEKLPLFGFRNKVIQGITYWVTPL